MNVTVRLITDMLGTVPKDPEVYKTYIDAERQKAKKRHPVTGDDGEELETLPINEEKGWTGFHSDEHGLFIYDYMVKGLIKHAGNVLKDQLGIKNLRYKIEQYIFVMPRRIHFGREKPDGVLERPLRAMTQQGPRTSLTRSDIIAAGTELQFEVIVLPNKGKEVTEELVTALLEYGKLQGLGQWRSGGYGRFEVVK